MSMAKVVYSGEQGTLFVTMARRSDIVSVSEVIEVQSLPFVSLILVQQHRYQPLSRQVS